MLFDISGSSVYVLSVFLDLRQGFQQQHIGFHVQRVTRFGASGTIPFNRVVTNYGGMWDTLSYMFMAPVKGIYVFHVNIVQQSRRGNTNAAIVRDGTIIAFAHVYSEIDFGSSSASVVLELEAYNRVYVRLEAGYLEAWSPYGINGFSGFLLYPV